MLFSEVLLGIILIFHYRGALGNVIGMSVKAGMLSNCRNPEKTKILTYNLNISCSRYLGWFTEGIILGIFSGIASSQSLSLMFASFFQVDYNSFQESFKFIISQALSSPSALIVSYSKKIKFLILKADLVSDLEGLHTEMITVQRFDNQAILQNEAGEYVCESDDGSLLKNSFYPGKDCVFEMYQVQAS